MRNRDHADPRIETRLERFAEIAEPENPMYAAFARAAASDAVSLELLLDGDHSQPPPNLLLGAVHYLLLEDRTSPLASHYGLSDTTAHGDPVELFLEYVHDHGAAIREQVATRRVQTNEVRRAALYVSALGHVAATVEAPIHLIEVGASAGLNLCFDRYRYEFDGVKTGPSDSPLLLTTEVRAGSPPIPVPLPVLAGRIGVDIDPVDLTDPDTLRWARALMWPEHPERIERFERAVELVVADPPPIVRGDGFDLLTSLVGDAPDGARVVVLHSFALYQASDERRAEYDALLTDLSYTRPIDRISIEILRSDLMGPEIVHTRYEDGSARETLLARAHHHGAWVEWLA